MRGDFDKIFYSSVHAFDVEWDVLIEESVVNILVCHSSFHVRIGQKRLFPND
jgi:hypothetical protein